MVKMVGNLFKEGKLINELTNEKIQLMKENRELNKEIHRLNDIIEQYKEYYADENNVKEAIELTSCEADSDIVTYKEWFESEASNDLVQAYEGYYND